MTVEPLSSSLYLTEGSSDKEYHTHLVAAEDGSGWLVNFQYGRRGRALRSGTKTASALGYAQARKVFEELVAEKKAKGYTPSVSGAVYQDTVEGEDFTGLLPMLPQAIRKEDDIQALIGSSSFVAQEKFDGENRQVKVNDSTVSGINKRGMAVPLPRPLADAVRGLGVDLLISGEQVGDTLHVFDVQEWDGKDLRSRPYTDRLETLGLIDSILRSAGEDKVVVVSTAITPSEKRNLADEIRARAGEGVVFKKSDAHFSPGKLSATQSSTFKWKFTEDCTVRVASVSKSKRSVSLETDHEGSALPLGKVSIPANQDMPKAGDLVSVTYLHLYEEGSLYQSQYKGVRTDCDGPDSLDMFKVKQKEPAPSWAKGPRP